MIEVWKSLIQTDIPNVNKVVKSCGSFDFCLKYLFKGTATQRNNHSPYKLTQCQWVGASHDPSCNTGRALGSWGCHDWDWPAGHCRYSQCMWNLQAQFLLQTCWWRQGLWWVLLAHWTWLQIDPALVVWICLSGQPQQSSLSHGDPYPQSWLDGPVWREGAVDLMFYRFQTIFVCF